MYASNTNWELYSMSHEIEIVNGRKSFVWAGERPWHIRDEAEEDIGTDVTGLDLTPMQMLEHAQCNWTVSKVQAYAKIEQITSNATEIARAKKAHKKVPALVEKKELVEVAVDAAALVRDRDGKVLDTVSSDWQPVQNEQAMEFFNEFVMAGDMAMETVGSLKGGQIVFGLARIKEEVVLFKHDRIQPYLLFSNFHKYGYSTDVRFTPVRVVCWNTHCQAMGAAAENMVKYSHRREFNPEKVKDMLGIAKDRLNAYKEQAQFLGSKKAKQDDIVEYFKTLLPGSKDKLKDLSKNAQICVDLLEKQPGHQYAPGTWWQPYNALTFFMDHVVCKTTDQRLKQSWYGSHKTIKDKGMELALDYAKGA
jgi:phage/plasmid-like protein (TIGR03299 family)